MVGLAAMIERTCVAHLEAGANGPLVTTVDGVWAYCVGGGDGGHDSQKINPTALRTIELSCDSGTLLGPWRDA